MNDRLEIASRMLVQVIMCPDGSKVLMNWIEDHPEDADRPQAEVFALHCLGWADALNKAEKETRENEG